MEPVAVARPVVANPRAVAKAIAAVVVDAAAVAAVA
jgi:hypothetical protein